MQVKAARIVPTLWTISRALGYVLLLQRPPWCRYRLFTAYISPTFYSMAVVLATAITLVGPRFPLAPCIADSAERARLSVAHLFSRLTHLRPPSSICDEPSDRTPPVTTPTPNPTDAMRHVRCARGPLDILMVRFDISSHSSQEVCDVARLQEGCVLRE